MTAAPNDASTDSISTTIIAKRAGTRRPSKPGTWFHRKRYGEARSSGRPSTCGEGPSDSQAAASSARTKKPRDRMNAAARVRMLRDSQSAIAYAMAARNSNCVASPRRTSNSQRSSVRRRNTITAAAAITCPTATTQRTHAVRVRHVAGSGSTGARLPNSNPVSASRSGTAPGNSSPSGLTKTSEIRGPQNRCATEAVAYEYTSADSRVVSLNDLVSCSSRLTRTYGSTNGKTTRAATTAAMLSAIHGLAGPRRPVSGGAAGPAPRTRHSSHTTYAAAKGEKYRR